VPSFDLLRHRLIKLKKKKNECKRVHTCVIVTSSRNTVNSACVEDRDFLHNISDLMLHRARLYEELSRAFRHLLELKQDV